MTLQEVLLDSPLFGKKRIPTAINDFGDEATVGLNIKRMSKNFSEFTDHDFGVYLGYVRNKYHIGTCEILSFAPSKLESFNTLEELKKQWGLD